MPDTGPFRDANGHWLRVIQEPNGALLLLVTDPTNTVVSFKPKAADFAAIVEAMFRVTGESAFLVEDVDVASATCLPFAEGQVGYDSALGHVWLNFDAGHLGEFDPDAAVEVGTLMVAFGRRAQRETAEAENAVEVSDMANDMAEMPWAPPGELRRLELAAAMVRAGYGRRPADG